MTENEKNLVLVSLQNGIGLSAACEITMLDVQKVSEYIKSNKDYHISCINAIKSAATTNLEFLAKLKKEKKANEWHRQQERIKTFIIELTLWESYCKKSDLTQQKVMTAAHIYKTIEECATSIGMCKRELIEYIISDEMLSLYFTQANLYHF